ncbi:MAG: hypothetical protein ACOCZ9_01155 [Spirochaetota bacterium]
MSSAAGAAGAGAAAASAGAESARVAALRRRMEGDSMSIWLVNQDRNMTVLAIGLRTKRSRLQAQSLGSGGWETVAKFADNETCDRVFREINAKLGDKDVRKVEIPSE